MVPPPNVRNWRILHSEASQGWGGQEHRVMAELKGFLRRGHSLWLIAHPESQILLSAIELGINVVPCQFERQHLATNALRLAWWLRRQRIDVVNTHSSRDGWLLGIAARLARTPLLIRSRHIDVSYRVPSVSKHAFTTFADHVLTTSDKITTHFKRLFTIANDHITTLPTGIDVSVFHPEGPKACLPVKPGRPVVGMVSVLRSWKGHRIFFDAIRILRDEGRQIQFVVVGGGGNTANFERMANDHGVGAAVAFTGHREDIPDVLRALDILCIPSTRHEGVPQIGLQALACGTAVTGSDCGGIPEIIREGETGRLFPIGDAAALARRIVETLDQKDDTNRMRSAGRSMVVQDYSSEVMLDKLEAIYRRYLPL